MSLNMDIKTLLNDYKKNIDSVLLNYVPISSDGQDNVTKAMKYSLENGGKRLRPILVLLFAQACRENIDMKKALDFACSVEMIHTYSLIHDDLPCMDNDDMRRGKPSCHKQFGEDIALLAGDGLLTLAFEMLADASLHTSADIAVKCISQLAKCAGVNGMIGGQVVDLENEGKDVGIDSVTTVNLLKTGALIKASCLIGCYIGAADEKMIEAASVYADKLGIAFQIQDDILDVVGDEKLLGKPVGSDSDNEKTTYVSLLGLEKSKQLVSQLTEEAVNALEPFGARGETLKALARYLVDRKF